MLALQLARSPNRGGDGFSENPHTLLIYGLLKPCLTSQACSALHHLSRATRLHADQFLLQRSAPLSQPPSSFVTECQNHNRTADILIRRVTVTLAPDTYCAVYLGCSFRLPRPNSPEPLDRASGIMAIIRMTSARQSFSAFLTRTASLPTRKSTPPVACGSVQSCKQLQFHHPATNPEAEALGPWAPGPWPLKLANPGPWPTDGLRKDPTECREDDIANAHSTWGRPLQEPNRPWSQLPRQPMPALLTVCTTPQVIIPEFRDGFTPKAPGCSNEPSIFRSEYELHALRIHQSLKAKAEEA